MKTLAYISLEFISLWCITTMRAQDRPNIVLIMADDMGFSDMGCYGGEINTPNLDRLAAEGVRFTQFYNAARCCPTRASLLTGLYPHQAGIGYMEPGNKYNKPISHIPEYQGYLNTECVTIAEALKLAGYQTFMSGKWHVGEEHGQEPLDRGFNRFYGILGGASHFFQPREGQIRLDQSGVEKLSEDYYTTDYFSKYASKFVREAEKDKPFFLYLAYTAPHWPMHAWPSDIAKYRDVYRGGWDSIRSSRYQRQKELGLIDETIRLSERHKDSYSWADEQNKDDMSLRMAVYAAMVDRMDQGIGQVIEALKERGELENTLILFLSDNGGCAEPVGKEKKDGTAGTPDSFQGYLLPWANTSNTPFRLFKHWVHEGGISTPLVAYWPKKIPSGSINREQTGHVKDIMATLLDAAGANYPKIFEGFRIKPMEGHSLLPAMIDPRHSDNHVIYWEHEGNCAIRVGNWKLVSYYNDIQEAMGVVGTGKRTGEWELYNISEDRTETNNVIKDHKKMVTKMLQDYDKWTERLNIRDWESLLHTGGYD
jgi:arylsulfatase A-like enzyme